MIADFRQYEGACGDCDEDGFGPIFIQHRESGADVIRAVMGVRARVLEISQLEVPGRSLTEADVVALIVRAYLFDFADDYYRGRVDRVALTWADGATVAFDYPAAPA